MNDLMFAVAPAGGGGIGRQRETSPYDIEAGYTAQQSEQGKEMEQFFAKVEEVKADLADIRSKQREVQEMHERSKTIVRQKEMQRHREDMQVRGRRGRRATARCWWRCGRSGTGGAGALAKPQPSRRLRFSTPDWGLVLGTGCPSSPRCRLPPRRARRCCTRFAPQPLPLRPHPAGRHQ
jgi:hypothetical protein